MRYAIAEAPLAGWPVATDGGDLEGDDLEQHALDEF